MLLNWISAQQGSNTKELPELLRAVPGAPGCGESSTALGLGWLHSHSCTRLAVLGQPEGSNPKACAAFWDVQPQWHQNLCVRADG